MSFFFKTTKMKRIAEVKVEKLFHEVDIECQCLKEELKKAEEEREVHWQAKAKIEASLVTTQITIQSLQIEVTIKKEWRKEVENRATSPTRWGSRTSRSRRNLV